MLKKKKKEKSSTGVNSGYRVALIHSAEDYRVENMDTMSEKETNKNNLSAIF